MFAVWREKVTTDRTVWDSMCAAQSDAHEWRHRYEALADAVKPLLDEIDRVFSVTGYDLRDLSTTVGEALVAGTRPVLSDQQPTR